METIKIYDQMARLERHMRSTKNVKLKAHMADEYRRLMDALEKRKTKVENENERTKV